MALTDIGQAGAVGRKPKLAELVVDSLRKQIATGQFATGHKLPTEGRMTEIYGVSRTVVREAIAALAADGMVEARQGAGVFVIANAAATFSSIGGENGKLSVALNVLEVRLAIEIESAALAATRRSVSQEAAIEEAFGEYDRLLSLGLSTGKADFAFHCAIAAATNNPVYVEILQALGSRTIPCDVASPWRTESNLTYAFQAGLQLEHRAILDAISLGDANAAREAMRTHLTTSQQRYRARLPASVLQFPN